MDKTEYQVIQSSLGNNELIITEDGETFTPQEYIDYLEDQILDIVCKGVMEGDELGMTLATFYNSERKDHEDTEILVSKY